MTPPTLDDLHDALPAYRRVYAGGHHEVLCNGDWHLWITAGPCQPHGRFLRQGRCDCARWQAVEAQYHPITPKVI